MYVNINCDVSTSPLPSVTLSCVRCHSEWALLTLSTAISKQKLWSNVSLGFLPGQRSFHGAILLFRLYFGRRCETRDSHCEGLGGCRNLNGSEHEQILRKVFDTTVLCNMVSPDVNAHPAHSEPCLVSCCRLVTSIKRRSFCTNFPSFGDPGYGILT